MRKINIIKSVAIAMALLLAGSANAQKKVSNISTKSVKACREYLTINPLDTIVNVVDVEKDNQKIGVVRRTVFLKEGKATLVVDTLQFEKTSTDEIAFADKQAFLRGEKAIVAPHHKDMEGKFRHKVSASVLGGMHFLNGEVVPSITGRLGYETCYFLFELEGSLSRARYTEQAEVLGHYMTFSANGSVGVKLWQDKLYRSYIAILGTIGYGYQKTDSDAAEFMSKNYGLNWGGMLRGSWGVTQRLRLIGEAGYKVTPKVLHDGGTQEIDNGGVFVNAGIGYTF